MRMFLKEHAPPIAEATIDTDADAGGKQIEVADPDGHHVRFVERDRRPASQTQERTDKRISHRILHAGLTIREVSAADAFYKDALGFSEIWRGGRTPDVTSWINMRVPDATEYSNTCSSRRTASIAVSWERSITSRCSFQTCRKRC